MFKFRSILEVYFQFKLMKWTFNVDVIYFQTQKYALGRLSKFMYLCTNSAAYLKVDFQYLMYLF